MSKNTYFKCKVCKEKFVELEDLCFHLEKEHGDLIPKDFTPYRYYYYLKTGKTEGRCVECKNATEWNEETGKYERYCRNPKCKENYVIKAKSRMIGKYGKMHLLDDPGHQRKMLANRSISGEYTWSDGTKKTYTGSYELDFLKFLDLFLNYKSSDVITPSPHTYYYMYEGEKKFYIPDVYIPSLGLEIEVKDGGSNPNMHHKIQAVDKVKEKLKDEVLTSQTALSYIKILDKGYLNFLKFLTKKKELFEKYGENTKPIFILENEGRVIVKESIDLSEDINRLDNVMEQLTVIKERKYDFTEVRKILFQLQDDMNTQTKENIELIKELLNEYSNKIKSANVDEDIRLLNSELITTLNNLLKSYYINMDIPIQNKVVDTCNPTEGMPKEENPYKFNIRLVISNSQPSNLRFCNTDNISYISIEMQDVIVEYKKSAPLTNMYKANIVDSCEDCISNKLSYNFEVLMKDDTSFDDLLYAIKSNHIIRIPINLYPKYDNLDDMSKLASFINHTIFNSKTKYSLTKEVKYKGGI